MLGRLFSRAEPAAEERALQVLPWGDWYTDSTGPSAAGVYVSTENATNLLTVYGCTSLISDTIATLPRCIYRQNQDGTKTEVQQTPRWLNKPNDYTTMIDFITQSCVSLLLDGNAYWVYEVDRNLTPTSLHCIEPRRVDVRAADNSGTYDDGSGVAYFIDGKPFRGRLVHIKGLTRAGHLKGLSPVEAARQSIGIGMAAQQYAGRFYANGAHLSGVITTPNDLTVDQARDLTTKFGRDHNGANAHKPGVLDNGASWQAISITPEQAQFLQSREYTAAEICAQMFLLDPSMLGIAINRGQNLTYANLEQRGIHMAQFTVLRWIVRLEDAFSDLLPKPQELKFDLDGLMRADLKTRGEYAQMALGGAMGSGTPWERTNDLRQRLFDLDPLPEFDEPAQPTTKPTLLPVPQQTATPPASAANGY